MLVLATQDEPKLAVSTFEIEAADRRYTVDTVEHFIGTLGDTSELFFIMGADSWVEITTWRDWKRLLTMVNHIVVTRPGYDLVGPVEVKDQIVDLRSSDGPVWNEQQGPRIYLTDVVMNDVSATEIRSLAGKCQYENLAALLSQPVVKYLEKYGIYQESNED
jgi:nicotinate-nucleotide adenylyltransferase